MPPPVGLAKVSIIGAGQVGMAIAFSLLSMDVCSDLALVDNRKGVLEGERLDLVHGQAFLGRRCSVEADTSYDVIKVHTADLIAIRE